MTKNLAQNEIRKDGAHHHKIARISILEMTFCLRDTEDF